MTLRERIFDNSEFPMTLRERIFRQLRVVPDGSV